MRPSLPLREVFMSAAALALALLSAVAPIATAWFLGVMPCNHYVMYEHVTRSAGSFPPPLPPRPKSCARVNYTANLLGLKILVNAGSSITLILAGVLAALTLGQTIEYRYFFLEVLDAGGRLKAFIRRYALIVLASVFIACLSSLTTASVLLEWSAFPSYWRAISFALWVNVLAAVMGASVASLASAIFRSVSGGILCVVGFTALFGALACRLKFLDAVVTPANIYFRGGLDALVYAAFLTLSNAFLLARVVRLEY